jgi:hypothetical protein
MMDFNRAFPNADTARQRFARASSQMRLISRRDPSEPSLDSRTTKWLFWTGTVAFLAISCLISLASFATQDESWFLRVLQRVTDGEVLYRDVYYPLLPLPVYVGVAATAIFGSDFHVLQALFFACFIASFWVTYSSARLLKIKRIPMAVLVLAICVWASPAAIGHVWSLYQPLATLFLLISLRMVLGWIGHANDGKIGHELVIAAIAAGAGFASKDQVGLLSLVALFCSILSVSLYRRFAMSQVVKTVTQIVAIFTGTVLLTLVPTALQGGLDRLAEYFVVERTAAIPTSSIPYTDGIKWFMHLAGDLVFLQNPAETLQYSMYVIVPIVAVLLFGLYLRRRSEDGVRAFTLFCFSIAAGLSIYPRSDVWHVLYLGFVFVLGLIFVADRLLTARLLRGAVLGTLSLCLVGGFAELIWDATVRIERLDYQYVRLPHFEYAMAPGAKIEQMKRDIGTLKEAAVTSPVFLLTDEAGFYYLISGIKNPTSIDYPMVAAMGKNGEADMIQAIQASKGSWVCVESYREPLLRPARVEEFIRSQLQFVKRLGFCDLYHLNPGLDVEASNGN